MAKGSNIRFNRKGVHIRFDKGYEFKKKGCDYINPLSNLTNKINDCQIEYKFISIIGEWFVLNEKIGVD